MTRISLSVLLLLGVGALQTLAARPRFQLEIGTDASGCVNVDGCSYGCGKISSSTTELNVLNPLCETVKANYPLRITIRGESKAPLLLDEDSGNKYKCSEIEEGTQQFVCRHKNRRSIKSVQASSSSAFEVPSPSSAFEVPPNMHPSVVNAKKFNYRSEFRAGKKPSVSAGFSSTSFVAKGFSSATASDFSRLSSTDYPSVSATSVYAAAATSDSGVCQYIPEILGARSGTGNLDDCCIFDDDCHGSCINGVCDGENNIPTETWNSGVSLPSPTSCVKYSDVYSRGRGVGNLGDCCVNSNDCRGACISGVCNAENNTPPPICTNNKFKGKRNGKGPEGVCCNTQADCRESCDRGVCTAPE